MLLQREVATLREVDEALARQALYGGDLVTNLIEVAHVEESQLLRVLAAFHGVQAWAPGPLPVPDPTAVALFPRDIAVEYGVVPLRVAPEVCDVAVAEPLAPALLEEMTFSLGLRLVQFVAIPARVRLALARTYETPLERRDLRVLARLDGLADPSPSEAPPANVPGESLLPPAFPGQSAPEPVPSPEPHVAREPEPAPRSEPTTSRESDHDALTVPLPVRGPGATDSEAPTAMPPRISMLPASLTAAPTRGRARSARLRRKGPFTLAMARDALEEADSHGALLRVLFDFSRQYFEYCALFLVREDIAEGVDASGPGADRERIRGIGVPLDLDGVLSDARRRKLTVLAIPMTEGVDAALRQDLRRPMNHQVLVIPVAIRKRVVALLYGDDGTDPVDMQQVGEVLALVPLVSAALERLILRKKLQRGEPAAPKSGGGGRETLRGFQGLPGLDGTAASQAEPPVPISAPGPLPSISAPFPAAFHPEEATRAGPPRRITASLGALRLDEQAAGPLPGRRHITASMGAISPPVPSPPSEPELTSLPETAAMAPAETASSERQPAASGKDASVVVSPVAASIPAGLPPQAQGQAQDGLVEAAAEASGQVQPTAAAAKPSEPEAPHPAADLVADQAAPDVVVGEADESDDMVMAVLDELQRSPEPRPASDTHGPEDRESFAATQLVAEGPRMPPKSSKPSDVGLPLVMVDTRGVVGELLDSLEHGDLQDKETVRVREEIVRLGDDAATLIAARFPGPIAVTPDPDRASLPPVSACGPVLAVASMLGRKVTAHIEPLLRAADSNTRFWAVLLLAELGGSIASRAVLAGVFDEDERVRMGARASMRTAAGRKAWVADVREKLRRMAESANEPIERRVTAIGALGGLRERATVPLLIDLLEAAEEQLRTVAHAALQTVARCSLPASSDDWRAWWDKNVARDRFEWLCDALEGEDDVQRAAAYEELEELAGQGFGFEPGQPADERAAVASRFHSWWLANSRKRKTDPPAGSA